MANPDSRLQLIQAIDEWLPQTQCTQCGFPRCLDYARAVEAGEADINQCPPGGDITIQGLAGLVRRSPKPLNKNHGDHRRRTVVKIDEPRCIGCTLCIQVCPVDAIVGARKWMHTVIEAECTGCELCLPPCPVDCIDVLPVTRETRSDWRWPDYSPEETSRARTRTQARLDRLERREKERRLEKLHRSASSPGHGASIRQEIAAAVSRVRSRRRSRDEINHE